MIRRPKRFRLYGGRQKPHGLSPRWVPAYVMERARGRLEILFKWVYGGACGPLSEAHDPCACHRGPIWDLMLVGPVIPGVVYMRSQPPGATYPDPVDLKED